MRRTGATAAYRGTGITGELGQVVSTGELGYRGSCERRAAGSSLREPLGHQRDLRRPGPAGPPAAPESLSSARCPGRPQPAAPRAAVVRGLPVSPSRAPVTCALPRGRGKGGRCWGRGGGARAFPPAGVTSSLDAGVGGGARCGWMERPAEPRGGGRYRAGGGGGRLGQGRSLARHGPPPPPVGLRRRGSLRAGPGGGSGAERGPVGWRGRNGRGFCGGRAYPRPPAAARGTCGDPSALSSAPALPLAARACGLRSGLVAAISGGPLLGESPEPCCSPREGVGAGSLPLAGCPRGWALDAGD